jgi:transcriptional regulator with XRE-family HTH domain
MNDVLRSAVTAAGLEQVDVAARLSVDPKTVERWFAGRVPHPRSRVALAALIGRDADELWPAASEPKQRGRSGGEVRAVYPHRREVPRDVWFQHFRRAAKDIGILVYSGLFLAEDVELGQLFASKARSGVSVRLLLGDPDSTAVADRGSGEGIGDAMSARIRNALALLAPVATVDGVELRLHGTVLYNSIFRADDELLVNTHAHGVSASTAPVIHLRRSDEDGMASMYVECFEHVWASAQTV